MTRGAPLVMAGILLAQPLGALAGQISVHVGAGARYATPLIRDSIVVPIELRPAIAPTLLLSVRDELGAPWAADVSLDVSPSGLRRHEPGATYDAGSVTPVALTVGVRRTFKSGITARFAIGGLRYVGSSDGPFRSGSGGIMPVGGVAGSYLIRGFALEARYDLHRFITPALRDMRFNNARLIHRVALSVHRQVLRGASTP